MHIEINLKNQSKLLYLVQLLQSLDFVESVTVQSDTSETAKSAKNRFDRYNGVWKNKLSNDEIDSQLNEIRTERERPI